MMRRPAISSSYISSSIARHLITVAPASFGISSSTDRAFSPSASCTRTFASFTAPLARKLTMCFATSRTPKTSASER
jgi:hypothetical protein